MSEATVCDFRKTEAIRSNIRKNELSGSNFSENKEISNNSWNDKANSMKARNVKDAANRNAYSGKNILLEKNNDHKEFDIFRQFNIPRNEGNFRQPPPIQRCQTPNRTRNSRPLLPYSPDFRIRQVRDLSTSSMICNASDPLIKEQYSRAKFCKTPEPMFYHNNGKTREHKFSGARRKNDHKFFNKKTSDGQNSNSDEAKPSKDSKRNLKKKGGFTSNQSNSNALSVPQLAVALSNLPDAQICMDDLVSRFYYGLKEVTDIALANPTLFDIKGNSLSLKSRNIICEKHLSVEGCKSLSDCFLLHICLGFVYGWCKDDACIYGHHWDSNHNKKYLSTSKLLNLPSKSLKKVVSKILTSNSDKNSLKICEDYIEGKCLKGMNCCDIHFCIKYLCGFCSSDSNCFLNHNIHQGRLDILMSNAGISMNESPRDILISFCHLTTIRDQIDSFTEKYKALVNSEKQSDQSGNIKGTSTKDDNTDDTHDANSKESQKTMWAYEFRGDVRVGEICYNSVESLCVNETLSCDRLHCSFHFHWQIKSNAPQFNYWVNLSTDFVIALEKAFCDPSIDKLILPSLDPASLPIITKGLIIILKGKTRWEADFDTMELVEIHRKDSAKQTSENISPVSSTKDGIGSTNLPILERLKLRRLCTQRPSNSGHHIPAPSIFNWYFLDKCNNWIEYGQIDSTGKENIRCNLTSKDIENAYNLKQNSIINFQSASFNYTLDLLKMKQTNLKTQVQRDVKRRPMPHITEEEKSSSDMELPSTWEPMGSDERVKRVTLSPFSKDYIDIIDLLQKSSTTVSVSKIERIQNPFHYRIFQQKVQEMTNIYKDPKLVDVRQLFHGTLPQCIQPICEQNFDWRLHGTHVGHAYGKGAYFSPFLSTSMGYSRQDASGNHLMLISCVAVGTTTLGSSGIVRPPMNSTYGIPYDSTVDQMSNPSIIVKYDKAEYYPQYIVTLR